MAASRAPHVAVVGAGVSGLAAAHRLRRDGPPGLRVTVLDGARAVGGKLRTSEVAGIPVDEGAEAFIARRPEALALLRELGLDDVVHPTPARSQVLLDGARRALPARTVMGVPADPAAVAEVLDPATVDRIAAEPGSGAPPVRSDQAVGELVGARLGRAVVDRLVDPLLGGVYAGRADALSVEATLPQLWPALQGDGSLVRAAQQVLAAAPADAGPLFGTLPSGLGTLVTALLAAAQAEVRLGSPVRRVERTPGGFRLTLGPVPEPAYLAADAVVVAAPAAPAARLLRDVAPAAAADLAGIDYASTALVTAAFHATAMPEGSGLLVPAVEGRLVKALTYSSAKWPHLAPGRFGGLWVLRASVGRFGEVSALQRDDDDLVAAVLAELPELTGVTAAPTATRLTRWGGALPQYAVGHRDRVRRIRSAVAGVPGLAVAGAAYDGVGIPACIRTANLAAAQVLGHLRALAGRSAERSETEGAH